MARDYAKRPHKRSSRKTASKSRRSVAPWTWLLTGLLTGLVVAAVAYLKITVAPSVTPPPSTAKAADPAPTPKKVAQAPAAPKFDFYTLLPEMEVAVPEAAAPAPKLAAEINLPNPLDQAKYRLQLASFKRYNDADTLKAKLAMSGHVVEIHSIKLDNGQVWYRVYTPVLSSREQAVILQKELQNQAISSMLLKATEG